MLKNAQVAFFLVFAAASATAVSAELQVKMSVQEPAGVSRNAEAFCGGIPLPRGRFTKDQEFSVLQGGRAVPAQVLPMVVGPDGCVRYLARQAEENPRAFLTLLGKLISRQVESSVEQGRTLEELIAASMKIDPATTPPPREG